MSTITIETESGSIYELDLEDKPPKFSRNGSEPQRLVEYRLYDNSWLERYFGAEDGFTNDFALAPGKFLFVHGIDVNNWYETTRITTVTYH